MLCENLKEHAVLVVEFLKEYYAKAAETIHKHDGVLDKFIGDGIMTFFGFHGEDDDAGRYAVKAVNAALELKESFERIRIVWLEIWKNKVKDYNTSIWP